MPLPRDRESLLPLAAEAQRVMDATPDPVTPDQLLKHAQDMLRLGEIRFRLDEMPEAERLLDQAATAFLKVEGPMGGPVWSAMARVRQAQVPMKDERFEEALAILDRAVEECGFPESATKPELRSQLVGQWLFLLDQTKHYDRLYDAAGTALDLFNEAGPERDRLALARAYAHRADAARALGRGEEAAELYAKAIAQFKKLDANLAGRQLIETTAKLTEVQSELGLVNESFTAFGQMASTVATTLPKLAMGRFRSPKRKSGTDPNDHRWGGGPSAGARLQECRVGRKALAGRQTSVTARLPRSRNPRNAGKPALAVRYLSRHQGRSRYNGATAAPTHESQGDLRLGVVFACGLPVLDHSLVGEFGLCGELLLDDRALFCGGRAVLVLASALCGRAGAELERAEFAIDDRLSFERVVLLGGEQLPGQRREFAGGRDDRDLSAATLSDALIERAERAGCLDR